jgi:carbamoyl-phosphate synthase large subunit
LGYEIVLVNSNPATIMTDPGMADVTYIEPLNVKVLTRIIAGAPGRRAAQPGRPVRAEPHLRAAQARGCWRNTASRSSASVTPSSAARTEGFQGDHDRLGIEMPRSEAVAYSVEEAEAIAKKLGYPVVIRPAYTMGGTGGGLVYNLEELRIICGPAGSPPAWSARCWWRNRCWAGRSWSWKWCATPKTR